MKPEEILVGSIGVVRLRRRENGNALLLCDLEHGIVGIHEFCGSGHVVVAMRASCNMLRCTTCNFIISSFPAEIRTYAEMCRYFQQAAEEFL